MPAGRGRGDEGLRWFFKSRRRRECGNRSNGGRKPVAFAGDGLDEAWAFRVVAEGLADLANCGIDSVLRVDEDFGSPEVLGDFIPGDELAVARSQQDEQLHRLALQLQASSGT